MADYPLVWDEPGRSLRSMTVPDPAVVIERWEEALMEYEAALVNAHANEAIAEMYKEALASQEAYLAGSIEGANAEERKRKLRIACDNDGTYMGNVHGHTKSLDERTKAENRAEVSRQRMRLYRAQLALITAALGGRSEADRG